MKYPELARAVSDAQGDKAPEEFAGEIGCGMSTLRRWLAGTHFPRSPAHRRALRKAGVVAEALSLPGATASAAATTRPAKASRKAAA